MRFIIKRKEIIREVVLILVEAKDEDAIKGGDYEEMGLISSNGGELEDFEILEITEYKEEI